MEEKETLNLCPNEFLVPNRRNQLRNVLIGSLFIRPKQSASLFIHQRQMLDNISFCNKIQPYLSMENYKIDELNYDPNEQFRHVPDKH